MCEVISGYALPSPKTKYKVMIKIGDLEISTDECQQVIKNYNRWNFRS